MDQLINKFKEAETQYKDLKARVERGVISSEQAKSEIKGMMIQDETGTYWMVGGQTGIWYKHINNQWQETNPFEEIPPLSTPETEPTHETQQQLEVEEKEEEESWNSVDFNQEQNDKENFSQKQYDLLIRCSQKWEWTNLEKNYGKTIHQGEGNTLEWNDWRKENPDVKVELQGGDFRKIILAFPYEKTQGANFSYNTLGMFAGANLQDANLRGANFSHAWLGHIYDNGNTVVRSNLQGANLRGADLSNADLQSVTLISADLRKANLYSSQLQNINLIKADLRDANLHCANISHAYLMGANLSNAKLREADLSNSNLQGANLSNANLREADLNNANLQGANLQGANLSNANLREADLSNSNLQGANPQGVKLMKANFDGADLQNCKASYIIKILRLFGFMGKLYYEDGSQVQRGIRDYR